MDYEEIEKSLLVSFDLRVDWCKGCLYIFQLFHCWDCSSIAFLHIFQYSCIVPSPLIFAFDLLSLRKSCWYKKIILSILMKFLIDNIYNLENMQDSLNMGKKKVTANNIKSFTKIVKNSLIYICMSFLFSRFHVYSVQTILKTIERRFFLVVIWHIRSCEYWCVRRVVSCMA